jgi:hypothetical protein
MFMNGALNGNVSEVQAAELFSLIEDRVSKRKQYVKVAVMLALRNDTDRGEDYTAGEIATRAEYYVKKNCGINGFEAGATLMLLVRMGLLSEHMTGKGRRYRRVDGGI